ncbi:DUF6342 family protein [Streptomyces sp. NPDC048717]|uniref:DUF6342 family protein n=1 Tax=unclassified Streptomyces TaxID=2593676 RepID=UPI00341A0AE7
MADVDLGVASGWDEGDFHGRVKLQNNRTYPDTPEKDVLITSPNSIELVMNGNHSSSQEADKIYFTTYHGSSRKVVGILDSDGNLRIAGKVITDQKDMDL